MRPYPSIHDRPGIYEYIRAHAPADHVGLTDGGEELPDEAKVLAGARIGWAAGALDGVGGYDRAADDRGAAARMVADLIPRTAAKPNARALRKFYETLATYAALDIVDPLIAALAGRAISPERLRDLALWLATTAPDREPVKVGIALLGVSGLGDRIDVVRMLGRHEEFTLYAAVAFNNGVADPAAELFALAQQVNGWGRIQVVRRLASTRDPAIRNWILRSGFRNSIMYEYLAYIAATTGDLAGALAAEPDRELLTASGEILTALYRRGPVEDIDNYADAVVATERLLGHLADRSETLDDANAVWQIERFLARDDDWDAREVNGWSRARRDRMQTECAAILGRPRWVQLVSSGLRSSDSHEFRLADELAHRVGIDALPVHRARLEANPLDRTSWYRALALADDEHAAELIQFASQRLPLDEIAAGPSDTLGFGRGFEAHGCLDMVLPALQKRPGEGMDLLAAALRSPVTRNRNLALRALEEWEPASWPPHLVDLVQDCAANDPNEKTRAQASELIASTEFGPSRD